MKITEEKTVATSETLANIIESIVFVAGNAISAKDIAERLGISGCLVTKRTKKIIEFIKNDPELSSLLRDLL